EMRTRLGLGPDDALFNLTLRHNGGAERFLNLTVTNNSRRIDRVLKAESNLAQWDGDWAAPALPKLTTARTKWKALFAALAEDPPGPATIDAAQQVYDAAKNDLDDDATKAEKKLAKALAAKPQVPAAIAAAETELNTAEGARKASDGKALDQTAYEGSKDKKT